MPKAEPARTPVPVNDKVFVTSFMYNGDERLVIFVGDQLGVEKSSYAYTIDDALKQVKFWLERVTTLPEHSG